MNYEKAYNAIISRRRANKATGYTEEHHIVPKCLGGTDSPDNLIRLTAREHFVCHLLLTKMFPKHSNEYYKMCHAFMMMLVSSKHHQQGRVVTLRVFDSLRVGFCEHISKIQSGTGNSQFGTMWITNLATQTSKRVSKQSEVPAGCVKGRIVDFDKYYARIEQQAAKTQQIKEDTQRYTDWYKLYDSVGWNEFVRLTGYTKTQDNLTKRFKQYCGAYKPQNGKKRGS